MFHALIEKRRSIRKYSNREVEKEKIDQLVESALRAPSSRGINPWEFIVVNDKIILEKLSMSKPHGASFLRNAPLGIVVCGNQEKSDVWIEDTSIASIFIHLASESMGLGSCWIQIRERMYNETKSSEAYIADILKLPVEIRVESIIAIGYPADRPDPHPKDALHYHKVYAQQYGKPFLPDSV